MHNTRHVLALLVGAALAWPAAAADLTVAYKVTSNGKTSTVTDYYTPEKFRTGDAENETIFETASGRIVSIDHKRKEYSETTLAEIEAALAKASAQVEEAMKQQEEAMKNMPPAMREKLQKMMGGGGGLLGGLTVTKGAGTREIAGYATQQYVVAMGDAMKTEIWSAEGLTPPVHPGQLLRLRSLASPALKAMGKASAEFEKIKGMPLATTSTFSFMGRSRTETKEATEVKTGPVPATAFDVPAGYKKVASPLTKMGK